MKLFAIISLLSLPCVAAVIPAASPSRTDVGTAVASSIDGDTIIIPPGTNSWPTTLEITKAITLQGAGTNQTVILDDIIQGSTDPSEACIYLNTTAGKFYRVTGIEFRLGSRASDLFSGTVQVWGNSSQVRIDHCRFDRLKNAGIYWRGATFGLVDRCDFYRTENHFIAFKNSSIFGKTSGDGSYETPVVPGSADNIFVEDNDFWGDDSDAFGGARFVFRFNRFHEGAAIKSHGTESTGRFRSARWMEVYGNTASATTSESNFVLFRGGSGLVASNIVTGSYNTGIELDVYRAFASFNIWGGADGTNAWDLNIGLQDSGTCTASASLQMTDNTKSWTVNQWAGMELKNKTANRFSMITANTATTLSYLSSGGLNGGNMVFTAGDAYDIRRVNAMLDQPGRGLSDAINTASPAWPNQQVDTIYQWANTLNAAPMQITSSYGTILEGREFTNNVALAGWVPYTYPHPLIQATNTPAPPGAGQRGRAILLLR